jgi:hypothetical protein
MPLLALDLFARIVTMRINAGPPLYGDFDVKNKMRHKHLFLSAPPRCDEQGIDSSLSLVAQSSHAKGFGPHSARRGRPERFDDLGLRRRQPDHPQTYDELGRGRKPRRHATMRGGARFDWRRLIVSGSLGATSLYSADLNRSKP